MGLTTKQTKAARAELLKRLSSSLRPTRITSFSKSGCHIEGGVFPARYQAYNDKLIIWGRGNRFSGGEMSVEDLEEVQSIIREFYNTYLESLSAGEIDQ